jgi:CheY-like chemotaxis protein
MGAVGVLSSVLVAERDASLRQVLAEVTRENFPDSQVYVVGDADELLRAIPRLQPPSVAVLHSGLMTEQRAECVRQLRGAGIPIVLTSAWDPYHATQDPGPAALLKAGEVQALLRKPFDLYDYIVLLQRLLPVADADSSGSVLVVEDETDLRETVADVLKALGRRVFTAGDGSDALRQLDGDRIPRPCLILLDWFMAPMGGKEFLEKLRPSRRRWAIGAHDDRGPGRGARWVASPYSRRTSEAVRRGAAEGRARPALVNAGSG